MRTKDESDSTIRATRFFDLASAVAYQQEQIGNGAFASHIYSYFRDTNGDFVLPVVITQDHFSAPIVPGEFEDPPEDEPTAILQNPPVLGSKVPISIKIP